ncbi:MAG: hypothetical protein HY459_02310 [Parcubacteria group bacterium]|nr:hypothetical protein [Parcubacteria group bacterium]
MDATSHTREGIETSRISVGEEVESLATYIDMFLDVHVRSEGRRELRGTPVVVPLGNRGGKRLTKEEFALLKERYRIVWTVEQRKSEAGTDELVFSPLERKGRLRPWILLARGSRWFRKRAQLSRRAVFVRDGERGEGTSPNPVRSARGLLRFWPWNSRRERGVSKSIKN